MTLKSEIQRLEKEIAKNKREHSKIKEPKCFVGRCLICDAWEWKKAELKGLLKGAELQKAEDLEKIEKMIKEYEVNYKGIVMYSEKIEMLYDLVAQISEGKAK